MAKRKYYYVILNKENGQLYFDCGRLPIFYRKDVASQVINSFDAPNYRVFKISIADLEKLFLKSKP